MIAKAKSRLKERVGEDHTFDPLAIVKRLTSDWKERERDIITARSGLFTEANRKMTLDALGKRYRLSRERVRQIERDVYKKLNKTLKELYDKERRLLVSAVEAFGGIAKHEAALQLLVSEPTPEQSAALKVLYSALPEIKRLPSTKHNYLGWTSKKLSVSELHNLLAGYLAVIDKAGKIVPIEDLVKKHPRKAEHDFETLVFLPIISSKLVVFSAEGNKPIRVVVRPKNIGDKIDFVLREAGEPLHFRDIAKRIRAAGFDNKRVLPETVHNELIRDKRFVLVGRGIYALSEWGYQKGTVKEVLEDILEKSSKPMSREEIMDKILSVRKVKKSTVLINLNNFFQKVGKNEYSIKK